MTALLSEEAVNYAFYELLQHESFDTLWWEINANIDRTCDRFGYVNEQFQNVKSPSQFDRFDLF